MPGHTGEIVWHMGRMIVPGAKGRFKGILTMVENVKNDMLILRVYTPESRTQDPPYETKEVRPGDEDLVLN